MFLMATVENEHQSGWSKAEQMENIMAESNKKRRKTRRGKKKPYKREDSDVFDDKFETDTLFIRSEIRKNLSRKRNVLRPFSSPKAPMNSTQFLIEDSGNGMIDFDRYSGIEMNSPDQMISYRSEIEGFESCSFYGDSGKTCFADDDEYIPMCLEDTTKFMDQEFEKEMLLQNDMDSRFAERKIEFKYLTKEDIVEKLMQLDNDLRRAEDRKIQLTNNQESKMAILLEENAALQKENKFLRSLLT